MQKGILLAIFVVSTTAILASFFLMLDVKDIPFKPSEEFIKVPFISKEKKPKQKSSVKDYFFPVDVLYVKIDLKKKPKVVKKVVKKKHKAFQLIIKKSNRHSLFCIRHTLSLFSLPYILETQDAITIITVDSDDKDTLEIVAKRLEQYKIKTKIKRFDI